MKPISPYSLPPALRPQPPKPGRASRRPSRKVRRAPARPDIPQGWYSEPTVRRERVLTRRRAKRMRRAKGRLPLRLSRLRVPTPAEVCDFAVAILWDQGQPNRNLVRVLRWLARDPAVPHLPENIMRKHIPYAGELFLTAGERLTELIQKDQISCRRTLHRERLNARRRSYHWTRFPVRQSSAIVSIFKKFTLFRPSAAGPPAGSLLFPGAGQKEVLLCPLAGGPTGFAAIVAAPRGTPSEPLAAA